MSIPGIGSGRPKRGGANADVAALVEEREKLVAEIAKAKANAGTPGSPVYVDPSEKVGKLERQIAQLDKRIPKDALAGKVAGPQSAVERLIEERAQLESQKEKAKANAGKPGSPVYVDPAPKIAELDAKIAELDKRIPPEEMARYTQQKEQAELQKQLEGVLKPYFQKQWAGRNPQLTEVLKERDELVAEKEKAKANAGSPDSPWYQDPTEKVAELDAKIAEVEKRIPAGAEEKATQEYQAFMAQFMGQLSASTARGASRNRDGMEASQPGYAKALGLEPGAAAPAPSGLKSIPARLISMIRG